MMRLYHSFSTRPLALDCYGLSGMERLFGNIWYYALSVAYARSSGAHIVLHTDTLGKALLGHLPYHEVHLTLDSIDPEISPRFWAAGKIYAHQAEELGAVHIDGDVFIKSPRVLQIIEQAQWDVVAQNFESPANHPFYTSEGERIARAINPDLTHAIDLPVTGAACCGIVGFRSHELRSIYTEAYRSIAREYSRAMGAALLADAFATPDLIAEQALLWQCARRLSARSFFILQEGPKMSAQADSIGFQHVMTSGKFAHLDKVKEILRAKFPLIYSNTALLCNEKK